MTNSGPEPDRTLAYYVTLIRRRWRLAATIVVASIAGAATYITTTTPKYTSQVQLFVATQPSLSQDTQDLYNGGQFTEGRVLSYVALVTSPSVTRPVIQRLGLHLTDQELANELSASVPTDTVLINIDVTDPSPVRAQRIASAVANRLISLIQKLERPGRGASPVAVSVSAPAQRPTQPVSPKKKLAIVAAIVLGLLTSIVAILVRERLDTTIRHPEDLDAVTALPLLSVVPMVATGASARGEALAADTRGEAMRQLRTNLQFVSVDSPIDSVVITSALPGEGKSTTALTLAQLVAQTGRTVILVDGDLRRPVMFRRAAVDTVRGLSDALVQEVSDVESFLVVQDASPNLKVLTAGSPVPNPSEILSSDRFGELLAYLRAHSDLVVIDAPPLLPVIDAALLAAQADGAVIVCEIGRTRRAELEIALERLNGVGAHSLGLVANKVRRGGYAAYYGYRYGTNYGAGLDVKSDTGSVSD